MGVGAARRRVRTLVALVILCAATLPLVTAQSDGESFYMLHIQSFTYIPDPLEVPPGVEVIVMSFPDPGKTPEETEPHTVTAVDRALFDVTNIPADGSQHPFVAPSAPGEYPYYCIYHGDAQGNGMAGRLVVNASLAPPASTPTAATVTPTASPDATPAAGNDAPLPWALGFGALVLVAFVMRRPR